MWHVICVGSEYRLRHLQHRRGTHQPSGNGVQVLPLSYQSNAIPSAVFVESPELVYAGEAAVQRADDRPQAFVPAPKRLLGYGAASVNGYEVAPSVLVAAVLRSVYDRALSLHNNCPPTRGSSPK